jgi:hypothetical protein
MRRGAAPVSTPFIRFKKRFDAEFPASSEFGAKRTKTLQRSQPKEFNMPRTLERIVANIA